MYKGWAGFTIVETMIALGISGAMLFAGLQVFSGQRPKTEFDQGVADLNSKIQAIIADVGGGQFDNRSFGCDNVNSKPILTPSPSAVPKCGFVGKAIQVRTPGENKLYIYTILGVIDSVGNIINPSPAYDGTRNLTESYPISPALELTSSKISSTEQGNLIVFSTVNGNADNRSLSVEARGGNLSNTDNRPSSPRLKTCIESLNVSPATCLKAITRWDLCFKGPKNKKVLLSVFANQTGATTNLDFNAAGCV